MGKKAKITKLNNFPNPLDTEDYLLYVEYLEEMTELERKILKKTKDLDEILDVFTKKIPTMRHEIEELAYNYLFLAIEKLKNIKLSVDDYEELNPYAYFCCQYAFRFRKATKEEIDLIEKYTSYDFMEDLNEDAEELRRMVKLFNENTGANIDPDSIDPDLIRSGNYDVIFNSVKDLKVVFDPVNDHYKFAKNLINKGFIKTKKDKQRLKTSSEKMLESLIGMLNSGLINIDESGIDINNLKLELENEIKDENYLAVFFIVNNIMKDHPELIRQMPEDLMELLGGIQHFRNLTLADYYKSLKFENKYFVIMNILDKNKIKSLQKLEKLIKLHENLLYNFKKDNRDLPKTKSKKDTLDYIINSYQYMDEYLEYWFK